jgi:hypothetical protein
MMRWYKLSCRVSRGRLHSLVNCRDLSLLVKDCHVPLVGALKIDLAMAYDLPDRFHPKWGLARRVDQCDVEIGEPRRVRGLEGPPERTMHSGQGKIQAVQHTARRGWWVVYCPFDRI